MLVSLNLTPYAPGATTDFAWVWSGAQALVHGLNPYDSVGPGRAYPFWSNLWYPLPAVRRGTVLVLPSWRRQRPIPGSEHSAPDMGSDFNGGLSAAASAVRVVSRGSA
jgi:hypothetical protein